MGMQASISSLTAPAVARLATLAELSDSDREALRLAAMNAIVVPARRDIMPAGKGTRERRILLSGWACRYHGLRDGRRQVLDFLLPGDVLEPNTRPSLAYASMASVTEIVMCTAPVPEHAGAGLMQAYAESAAVTEQYLLRQITRLGRLNAYERVCDWLLEIRERLAFEGAPADRFAMPLTQEMLADSLGLTSVHVNRTLQVLRRDGLILLGGGYVTLVDPAQMAAVIGHSRPSRAERFAAT